MGGGLVAQASWIKDVSLRTFGELSQELPGNPLDHATAQSGQTAGDGDLGMENDLGTSLCERDELISNPCSRPPGGALLIALGNHLPHMRGGV